MSKPREILNKLHYNKLFIQNLNGRLINSINKLKKGGKVGLEMEFQLKSTGEEGP